MRRSSVKEYVEAIRGRYRKANRREKGRMLKEFTEDIGYHRKSAIRLPGDTSRKREPSGRGRPCAYGPEGAHRL